MASLVERRRAEAEANDAAVLSALVARGEAGASVAELAAATGLNDRRSREVVRRLVERRLARRDGRRVVATPAGRQAAHATTRPGVGEALAFALEALPAEGLRAAFRLLASTTLARAHLRHEVRSAWPALLAAGPTKTGKTLLGEGICALFGLERSQALRLVPSETEHSLWGRRERGAEGTWHVEPAGALSAAFLVLDEWDKASPEVRRATLRLVQGETVVAAEGSDTLEVAPTVLLTTNASPDVLPEEYRRRSFVLSTAPLRALLTDALDEGAGAFLERLPRLDLARARPGAPLAPEVSAELRALAREGLTEDGVALVELRGLELAARGRVGLGAPSAEEAALATLADYLTLAETTGEASAARPPRLLEALGARSAALVAADTARLATGRRRAAAERERASLELVAARAEAAAVLEAAAASIARLPSWAAPRRAEAAGLRAALRSARGHIAASRSEDALDALLEAAAPRLDQARRLAESLEAERAARERHAAELAAARVAERHERAEARRAEWAWRAAQREEARAAEARRRTLRRLRARLRTKPGEDVAGMLLAAGALVEVVESYEALVERPLGAGLVDRLRGREHPPPTYETRRRAVLVDATGRRWRRGDLVAFGSPAVVAVLDAALAALEVPVDEIGPARRALGAPAPAVLDVASRPAALRALPPPRHPRAKGRAS